MRYVLLLLMALLVSSPAGCVATPTAGDRTLEEAIGYTPATVNRLKAIRDETMRECMARAGFGWRPDPPDPALLLAPHGLFGAPTPEAERTYRLSRGYGIAQTIHSLKSSNEIFLAENSQSDTVRKLSEAARHAYQDALNGNSATPGCQEQALKAVGGIDLEEGGQLGAAYGAALESMQTSDSYTAIEKKVSACMRSQGFDHGSSDWHLIERLVKLTGGTIAGREYTIGRVDGSAEVRIGAADLAALHQEEMVQARAEVACTDPHRTEILDLLRRFTRPVLAEHANDVRAFREQLERVRR